MARPKEYVRVRIVAGEAQRVETKRGGTEIEGLHFHKGARTYYTYRDGKIEYLGRDLQDALIKVGAAEQRVDAETVEAAVQAMPQAVRQQLSRVLDSRAIVDALGPDVEQALDALYRKKFGLPAREEEQKSRAKRRGTRRLAHVRDEYERLKTARSGTKTDHLREVLNDFDRFVNLAKNPHIEELTYNHFRLWREWVTSESKTRKSNKWANDKHAHVRAVFRYTKRHTMDWPWPAETLEWASAFDRLAYAPEVKNTQPMPVEVFTALLANVEAWIAIDIVGMPVQTPSERSCLARKVRKRRAGYQLRVCLLLGLNAGFDPVDFTRLRLEHLVLDGELPYVALPRHKVAGRVGGAVKRFCPLLPSTVAAIQDWLAVEKAGDGRLLRSGHGNEFNTKSLASGMRQLREEIGKNVDGWSFKHLRNVGPTLGRDAGISRELRDAFLGHKTGEVLEHYTAPLHARQMVDLVNLVGKVYLGETVGVY